jgi:hypothetical protein
MRQNPVGEPAATAALNFGTPRRRSSLKRLGPFCHCRQRYERNLRRIHASRFERDPSNPAGTGLGVRSSPDRADALVWAFTEILVEEIPSWGIFEAARRQAEALVKAKAAAVETGRPKPEPAPRSNGIPSAASRVEAAGGVSPK